MRGAKSNASFLWKRANERSLGFWTTRASKKKIPPRIHEFMCTIELGISRGSSRQTKCDKYIVECSAGSTRGKHIVNCMHIVRILYTLPIKPTVNATTISKSHFE